jgi:hypothetical protein
MATTGRYSSPQQSEPPVYANATAFPSQQNKNNPTITTTYNPKPANFPRSFKKKMLDKPFPPCYNGYIIIEMKKKMNKRFKTGDMIQIGSRKENVALVLGPAFTSEVEGGMWWVQRVETGKPIMIFQSQIIKVIS